MKQTCLESKAIDLRNKSFVRNDYTKNDEYSAQHPDALSNGDPLGKGTGHGGHTHSVPDCNRPSVIDYSSTDTNGGGYYDINGRDGVGGRTFLKAINLYSENNEYSADSIDTSLNVADGQIVI